MKSPKILALVCHYFGKHDHFHGQSTRGRLEERKAIVQKCLAGLYAIERSEVKVCGVPSGAAVPLDICFQALPDPTFLPYSVLNWMLDNYRGFDYVLVVEDDILVPAETISRILDFDRLNTLESCFHPNRVEAHGDQFRCVDLEAFPGWSSESLSFRGQQLQVARNPHSAFLCLSKEKIRYAVERIDRNFRGITLGGRMASAFAHFHSPFKLYRERSALNHSVIHLDNWDPALGELNYSSLGSSDS